jgi:galactose-1-phosphate uridylyltransferase
MEHDTKRPGKFKKFIKFVKSFFFAENQKATLIDIILKTIDVATEDFPKVKQQIEEITRLVKEKGIALNEETLQEILDITILILKCEKDLTSIKQKITENLNGK